MSDRRVILACTANPRYAFALPIACRLWQRIGYEPIVMLVGNQIEWEGPGLALAWSKLAKSEYWVLPIEGYNDSTVAQCARLAGWMLAMPGEYVLTADADMWPLGSAYFRKESGRGILNLFSWAAYAHEAKFKQPICYLGASRETWEQICGAWATVTEGLTSILGACGYGVNDWDQWNWDERWISRQIKVWAGFPDQCWNHPRGTGKGKEFWSGGPGSGVIGRIDRANWPTIADELPKRCIDAHLPTEPWAEQYWPSCSAILATYAGDELADWADEYRAAWMAADSRQPAEAG